MSKTATAPYSPRGPLAAVSALRHRNYLLLWVGMLVVFTGNWVQTVALSWLVYEMSDSPFLLGLVGFCTMIPMLVLALPAGVLADRLNWRRLLVFTQTAAVLNTLVLAILVTSGRVEIWHIIVSSLLSGTISALDIPCRQALVPQLVNKEDLMNAVALQAAAFNASRILGPPIAALLIEFVSIGGAFFVNAGGYLAMLVVLLAMQAPVARRLATGSGWWGHLVEGVVYVRRTPMVLALLSLVAVPTMFGMPYMTLMPVFARDVLNVGSTGLSALMSAIGVGALAAALGLAVLGNRPRKMDLVLAGAFLFGVGLMFFAVSTWFVVSLVLLALVGLMVVGYSALANTILQVTVPDHLRGRIMSVYMLVWGLMPLGQLWAGTVAGVWGAPVAVGVGGVISAGFVLVVAWRMPHLRHVS